MLGTLLSIQGSCIFLGKIADYITKLVIDDVFTNGTDFVFSINIYIFCCCFDAKKVDYLVLMNHIFDHGVSLVQSFGLLTSKPNMIGETS